MIHQITHVEESRPRGNKTPKADLELRVLQIVSMIEEGVSRSAILLHCATQYGVSRSTADRYIEEAYDHFKESYKPQMQRSAEIARRRLETIFQKAMKKEDHRTALMAQMQINKIQGLNDNLLMAGIRRGDTNERKSY